MNENGEWEVVYDSKNTTSEKQNTQELTESKTQQLETEQQAENQEVQSEPENETSYDENEDLFTNLDNIIKKDDLKKKRQRLIPTQARHRKRLEIIKKGT